jgi:DNA replication protein DnaC
MKFEIVNNEKPQLDKINFNCDEKICEKLEVYPMIRDNLNRYNTTVFVGRQGSGKTSLIINIIKKLYRKKFHKIYLFMPSSSRKSLKDNIFDDLPDEQLFEELNYGTLHYVYEKLQENSDKKLKSLIIMDDVQKSLKDNDVIKEFRNIVANQRHLKVVNFILLQNYFAVDNKIRELINNVIFFKMDKKQNEKIFKETAEMPKETFDELNNIIFDEPYNWCLINQREKKIYKMFDEIKYTDE